MVLTLTQLIEAFFIALILVLITSPHLLSALSAGHQVSDVFNFF